MRPESLSPDVGLFLDVDGTLIDIAPSPTEVVVPASLVRDLEAAERLLEGALALVSGRTIANLDQLFRPLRLKASGVHGAELRLGGRDAPTALETQRLPASAWNELLPVLERFPGALAENKGFSFAVHYRAAPESGPRLRQRLGDFVATHADLGLTIMPGHFVFELKRPGINKGAAIETMLARAPFHGRRPVFVGDDITDRPGFAAVLAHDGLAYSVGEDDPDVSGTFADAAAVRHWLTALVRSEAVSA